MIRNGDFTPPGDCQFIGAFIGAIIDLIGGAGTATGLGIGAADVGADAALGAAAAGGGEAAATAAGAGAFDAGATALGAGGALGAGADALSGLAGAADAGLGAATPAGALAGGQLALPGVADTAGAAGTALPAAAGTSAAGAAAPAAAAPDASALIGSNDVLTSGVAGGGGAGLGTTTPAALPATPLSAVPGATGQFSVEGQMPLETLPNTAANTQLSTLLESTPSGTTSPFGDAGTIGTGSGGGSSLGNIGSSVFDAIKSNPALDIGVAGLGYDLLKGNSPLPGQAALNTEATQLANQGTQLESYLQSGTLPAGVQASINQASQAAIAAIKSRYASMGGDTSAMEQDIANVQQQAASQGATIATQLLNQGVSETQLSAELYGQLMNLAQSQNTALGGAISSLAIAASGVPKIFAVQSTSS